MIWYLLPVIKLEDDSFVPAFLHDKKLIPYPDSYVAHCYNPKDVPIECMIGTKQEDPRLKNHKMLTLDNAKKHFEKMYGFKPHKEIK